MLVWCLTQVCSQVVKKKNLSKAVRLKLRWRMQLWAPTHLRFFQVVSQLKGLANCCAEVLEQIRLLVSVIKLHSGVLTSLVELCKHSLLVQGSDVHGLVPRCAAVLQEVYALHPELRESIVRDVFGVLSRLPTHGRHVRTYRISNASDEGKIQVR